MWRTGVVLVSCLWAATASADESLRVRPFLQAATPTSVWVVWETTSAAEATVSFGLKESLGTTVVATSTVHEEGGYHHEAQLTGLSAATRYHYQVTTGSVASVVNDLITPPGDVLPESFRVVAMSDMQFSVNDPGKYEELIEDGVLSWAREQWGDDVASQFAMVLIPGDLVDNGDNYTEWAETFFGPMSNLSAHVPVYPVLGNHERDAHWYYDYLHLPDDAVGALERWWSTQYANLVVIGLDTNDVATWVDQLAFAKARLDEACADDVVDFVFAEVHHPYQSELWTSGNNPLTGQLIGALEDFSTRCDKPSTLLFGHTHAYSRGQSRDHTHLMVNVASAGGALDRWTEQPIRDYPEFTVSEDDFGFVVFDITTGDDAALRLRRFSRGDRDVRLDNVQTDELTIRRRNTPPDTPVVRAPYGEVDAGCVAFVSSDYADADGDAHQATQWQLARTCDAWDLPLWERWSQDRDLYLGIDSQQRDDLTDEVVRSLDDGAGCVRVRHRDGGLVWSAWSEGSPVTILPRTHSDNLVPNAGAEEGVVGWVSEEGGLEATADHLCGTPDPASGARALALGGVCNPALPALASVDVSWPRETLETVTGVLHVGAMHRGGEGVLSVIQLDVDDAPLSTDTVSLPEAIAWTLASTELALAEGVDDVRVELSTADGILVDDVEVSVGPAGGLDCDPRWAPQVEVPVDSAEPVDTDEPDTDTDTDDAGCAGCGVAAHPSGDLLGFLFLGVAGWRRRRRR